MPRCRAPRGCPGSLDRADHRGGGRPGFALHGLDDGLDDRLGGRRGDRPRTRSRAEPLHRAPRPEWERALLDVVQTGRRPTSTMQVGTAAGPRSFCTRFLSQRAMDGSVPVGRLDRPGHHRARRPSRLCGSASACSRPHSCVRDRGRELDAEGRVVDWSDVQETLTGRSREEVLGRPMWECRSSCCRSRRRPGERGANTGGVRGPAVGGGDGPRGSADAVHGGAARRDAPLVETTAIAAASGGALLVTRGVEPAPAARTPRGGPRSCLRTSRFVRPSARPRPPGIGEAGLAGRPLA